MIEKFIAQVKCPSRYLGNEINSVRKDHYGRLKVALVFPDLYEIGMSHLGLQIIYFMLNSYDDVVCERAFAPAPDMEELLLKNNIPLVSQESRKPLKDFDVVAITLPSELNYTTALNILKLSGIPLKAKERDEKYPLILGGGPCALNPEPIADFFDAFFLGEVEDSMAILVQKLKSYRKFGKKEFLREFCSLPGIYVPEFFEPLYNSNGTLSSIKPLFKNYRRVERQVVKDFNNTYFPERLIVPFTSTVHDRLTMEISRGCTQGCRFCHAGMIYRPTRERNVQRILELTDKLLKSTGYEEISLMSLSAGDYSNLEGLISSLVTKYEPKKIAFSLPSLRVGTISEEVLKQIRSTRKTGITIALEAGTDRLRRVINKKITEEDALGMVESIFRLGWRNVKLYFMIGLPTEKDEDISGIVRLAKNLHRLGNGDITISLATFIPKPHTPFQWEKQIHYLRAEDILKGIKKELRGRGYKVKWQDPGLSYLEGILSRGDRRLSNLLEKALKNGCKLDSWTEHFDLSKWELAFAEANVDPEFYLRERDPDECLPWEHLGSLVTKEFLLEERRKAYREEDTEDCFTGKCTNCGACDFKTFKPEHADAFKEISKPRVYVRNETKYRLRVTKAGMMKYLSHLEFIRVIERALRRSGLQLEFKEGFHPTPKFSFSPAIPVGVESYAEYMDLILSFSYDPEDVMERLNAVFPDGISVVMVEEVPMGVTPVSNLISEMRFEVNLNEFVEQSVLEKIEEYNRKDTFPVFLEHKEKEMDAKKVIPKLYFSNNKLKFGITLNAGAGGINPVIFARTFFGIEEKDFSNIQIVKVDVRFSNERKI